MDGTAGRQPGYPPTQTAEPGPEQRACATPNPATGGAHRHTEVGFGGVGRPRQLAQDPAGGGQPKDGGGGAQHRDGSDAEVGKHLQHLQQAQRTQGKTVQGFGCQSSAGQPRPQPYRTQPSHVQPPAPPGSPAGWPPPPRHTPARSGGARWTGGWAALPRCRAPAAACGQAGRRQGWVGARAGATDRSGWAAERREAAAGQGPQACQSQGQ